MAEQFCLRWNNHHSTLASIFHSLLDDQELLDCSLAAEGHCVKAHRILLSACSPYFKALFREHPDQHPIFILKDVTYKELTALMDYMYKGEVNISQDELAALLKVAENLKIRGLSDSAEKTEEKPPRRVVPPPPTQKKATIPRASVPIERCSPSIATSDLHADKLSASADVPGPRKRKRARRQSSEEAALGQNQTSMESLSSTLSEPSSHVIQSVPSLEVAPVSKTNAVIPEPLTVRDRPAPDATVPKTEPSIEQVLVPKQEFDDTADDSYEDLTFDDDDDDNDMDNSQPGPSQGNNELSNQDFSSWQASVDGSLDEGMNQAQDGASGTGQGMT